MAAEDRDQMTEKVLVDSHELTCPVCLELFKKAKYLSCHHSYCEGCLEKLLQEHFKIICPECNKETTVPEGGVKNLPNNFHINRMVDENPGRIGCGECTSKDPAKAFCQDCNLYTYVMFVMSTTNVVKGFFVIMLHHSLI